jgi:transcriptional regulator with XRE-family HTH domain
MFVWLTSAMLLTVAPPESASLYASLGELIRRRRKLIGSTQATLAAQVGLTRASIANIECGRQKVMVHQLYQLAAALDLPVSDLLPTKAPTHISDELPLPSDLNARQRAQISKLFHDAKTFNPKQLEKKR